MLFEPFRLARSAILIAPLALLGCGQSLVPAGGSRAPALDVLAIDFERTVFLKRAQVSGAVAQAQRRNLVSTASSGRLRQEARGPIPTELRIEIRELTTEKGRVSMRGTVALRDLAFGKIMAELPDFRGSGPMPRVARGGQTAGLVFRGVEDEIIAWLSTLECDTALRSCGKAQPKPVAAAAPEVDAPEIAGADLDLDDMVGRRPGGLRKINSGGIDPNAIVAAAAPQKPAAPDAGIRKIGSTVAALGLLDRSGFWLKTPLVDRESKGEIVVKGSGKKLVVTLIPKDGPAGGGSQISLAALTELGAAMTDLVSLDVYR